MDIQFEKSCRKKFRELLLELSNSQNVLQNATVQDKYFKRLEELYRPSHEENFRHYYSDIFDVLVAIQKEQENGEIDILGQNLGILYENYVPTSKAQNISSEIKKLYDHVSLDIARILYSDAGDFKISGEKAIKDIQAELNKLNAEVKSAQKSQEQVEKELKGQQREYVAILGIFAAVVLAFTGGIAFSTSVLNNIDKVGIYKLITVALAIGIVLINILFGLFYYIDRLVNTSFTIGILPLLISNIVIITIMGFTIYSWY